MKGQLNNVSFLHDSSQALCTKIAIKYTRGRHASEDYSTLSFLTSFENASRISACQSIIVPTFQQINHGLSFLLSKQAHDRQTSVNHLLSPVLSALFFLSWHAITPSEAPIPASRR
jgi:hypothetical protein